MRDERFEQIAKALDIDPAWSNLNKSKLLILELALENAAMRSRLDTIAEYEGLDYESDQPIPFRFTEKTEAELGKPDRVGDFPTMDPNLARMASPQFIPDSAMAESNPVAALELDQAEELF